MKRLAALAALLLPVLLVSEASADRLDCNIAFDQGAWLTALRECRPVAEHGDVIAQINLAALHIVRQLGIAEAGNPVDMPSPGPHTRANSNNLTPHSAGNKERVVGPPERRLVLVFTALLTLTPAVALAQPWNTPVKSLEEQQREALEKACRAFARLCAPPAAPPSAAVPKAAAQTGSVPTGSQPMTNSSVLLSAAKDGIRAEVESLLSRGVSPNERGDGGETALHWAAAYGHRAVAHLLLAKGADVSMRDGGGAMPLQYAADEGHTELVRLLIENGANLNARNDNAMTALHVASANDHRDVVGLLLARGADIDATDHEGSTPLHLASALGRKATVEVLLRAGANASLTDNVGNTALDVAEANDHPQVAALIRSSSSGGPSR